MTASHRVTIDPVSPELSPEEFAKLSFREKVRRHFQKGKDKKELSKYPCRALFLFQASTQLYTTLRFLVPYVFQNYDPWTQYYVKVVVCFLCAQTVANWMCVMLYDSAFYQTKDRPEYDVGAMYEDNPDVFVARLENISQNGTVPVDSKTEDWSTWKMCDICKVHAPPRSHHCDYCHKCILKRDHHCFMVGNCVGFKNQRYFIIMTFYSAIIGLVGGFFTAQYLHDIFWPHSHLTDFILPVTFYRFVFGDLDLTTFLMIFHSYLLIPFGLLSCLYFSCQLAIVAQGITLFEISRNQTVKCTRPAKENFKSVFGDFWAINFLFPAQLVFKQREDGKTWDGIKIVPKHPTRKRASNML